MFCLLSFLIVFILFSTNYLIRIRMISEGSCDNDAKLNFQHHNSSLIKELV